MAQQQTPRGRNDFRRSAQPFKSVVLIMYDLKRPVLKKKIRHPRELGNVAPHTEQPGALSLPSAEEASGQFQSAITGMSQERREATSTALTEVSQHHLTQHKILQLEENFKDQNRNSEVEKD